MHGALCFGPLRRQRVVTAFGNRPDLVTGLATSTRAGIELVEKLSGIEAINVLDHGSLPRLRSPRREVRPLAPDRYWESAHWSYVMVAWEKNTEQRRLHQIRRPTRQGFLTTGREP